MSLFRLVGSAVATFLVVSAGTALWRFDSAVRSSRQVVAELDAAAGTQCREVLALWLVDAYRRAGAKVGFEPMAFRWAAVEWLSTNFPERWNGGVGIVTEVERPLPEGRAISGISVRGDLSRFRVRLLTDATVTTYGPDGVATVRRHRECEEAITKAAGIDKQTTKVASGRRKWSTAPIDGFVLTKIESGGTSF